MKECPNCKTMLEDDELFCHECGAKQEIESVANQNEEATTPLEKKCIHCGEMIEADSMFCPYCGKSQVVENVNDSEPKSQIEEPKTEEEPVAEEKIAPKEKETKPEEKPEPKETSAQEVQEEQTKDERKEVSKPKSWIWILLVVLLGGACAWYFLSQDSYSPDSGQAMAEAVDTDSVEEPDEVELNEEIMPTSPLAFLEQFYKGEYENEDYIKQHVTANVINKLKRDYEYECPSGDCLATWVFTAYPAGADLELEEGPIISETQVDGKFKVDFRYSGYNGEQKQYQTNTLFLTVTEIDGNYLISNYEVQLDGVSREAYSSDEQSSTPHLKGNELSVRKLNEDDISELEPHELMILRNIVYARYGLRFKNEILRKYYSQFNWYTPRTDNAEEIYNMMTEIEKYNVDFIKGYE